MSDIFKSVKDVFRSDEEIAKQKVLEELNKPKPAKYLYAAMAVIAIGIVIVALLAWKAF